MKHTATIRKRRRGNSVEYIARLIYEDTSTGGRKEKSKSCSSPAEAKRQKKKLEDEFLAGGQVAVESDEMAFEALVKHCKQNRYCDAEYDDEGRKLFGVRGRATVLSHIKALEAFFGKMKLREINVAALRAYRKSRLLAKTRKGTRLSVCTVNRELSTLRAMLNEALVNDWIFVNPFKRVRPGELITIADERKRQTVLSPSEEERLLKACEGEYRRHLKAFIIAALDTGARRGELLKLRWCDVDFDIPKIRNITSYKGKTVDRRPVPLTPRLAAALLDLREKPSIASFKRGRKTRLKPDTSSVFGIKRTLQTSWEAARMDANLQHIRLHDLRHTAGTRLSKKLTITDVGLILGHSDPRTTQRYVNRTPALIQEAGSVLHSWQQEQREFPKEEAVN